jgi:membrane protein implicated in regulation of membrane protease activity
MWVTFVVCAVVGGTVLACQFAMSMMGLAGHDVDIPDGDGIDGGVGHGMDGGGHSSGGHSSGGHSSGGHVPGGDGSDYAGSADSESGHDGHGHHGSTWLFGILSFRTAIAALTFFGLSGLASLSAGLATSSTLVIAIACGFGAMLLVHAVMRMFFKLTEDGTIRVARSIGLEAKVYVPIPADDAGRGKVQLRLQDRLVEYPAVTRGRRALATGARVRVVAVRGGELLEVRSLDDE